MLKYLLSASIYGAAVVVVVGGTIIIIVHKKEITYVNYSLSYYRLFRFLVLTFSTVK